MNNNNETNQKPNINFFSLKFFKRMKLSHILTSPFILMMIIPAVIVDILSTLYQVINFTAYKIPKVKRSKYIVIDRHHLKHLNFMEKFFCLYCGYTNGVTHYALEIGSRTEEFWCPIKHNSKIGYEHARYNNYLEYGDSKSYHQKRKEIRIKMKKELSEK